MVHRIEITIDPAAWLAYMDEHRSFGLRKEPKWWKGDFRIDGVALREVAFHSFGWGSRDENKRKPNLSVDLNRNLPGQRLGGITRMRIKNNGQDVTGLRQVLVYQALREAGLLAPRTSFAELSVNGEDLGVYLLEEAFTKSFVRERTGNEDGPAYEAQDCLGLTVPPEEGGCERVTAYYNRDFNELVGEGEDLIALCKAANQPDAPFPAALAAHVLPNEWIAAIAIDTALAGNEDGYSVSGSNFRLYHDTALDKFRLVIIGPDDTFAPDRLPVPDFRRPAPKPRCASNPRYRDLFLERLTATAEGLAAYQQAVRKLRTGIMAAGTLKARVDTLWALIGERIKRDPLRVSHTDPEASKEAIKRYVDLRWAALAQAGF